MLNLWLPGCILIQVVLGNLNHTYWIDINECSIAGKEAIHTVFCKPIPI